VVAKFLPFLCATVAVTQLPGLLLSRGRNNNGCGTIIDWALFQHGSQHEFLPNCLLSPKNPNVKVQAWSLSIDYIAREGTYIPGTARNEDHRQLHVLEKILV
jgi:hypothetical protein